LIQRPEYIVVGQFGRPHGVSGEIYLNVLTDNPERFQKKGTFLIRGGDGWKEIRVDSVKSSSGRPVVKIAGVDNSDQAKILLNEYLYIHNSVLGNLAEGSYYHFDLIDCRVVNESGHELGRVVDIETYPANDVLVIESMDGIKYLLPIIRPFLKEIDIEKKLIIIDPPEGIFDSRNED
jgi:16S rRNA processing protein RimM